MEDEVVNNIDEMQNSNKLALIDIKKSKQADVNSLHLISTF